MDQIYKYVLLEFLSWDDLSNLSKVSSFFFKLVNQEKQKRIQKTLKLFRSIIVAKINKYLEHTYFYLDPVLGIDTNVENHFDFQNIYFHQEKIPENLLDDNEISQFEDYVDVTDVFDWFNIDVFINELEILAKNFDNIILHTDLRKREDTLPTTVIWNDILFREEYILDQSPITWGDLSTAFFMVKKCKFSNPEDYHYSNEEVVKDVQLYVVGKTLHIFPQFSFSQM